jgi:hypothetical protein
VIVDLRRHIAEHKADGVPPLPRMVAGDRRRAYAPLYRTAPAWAETDGDLAVQLAPTWGGSSTRCSGGRRRGARRRRRGAARLPRDVRSSGPRQTVGKTVALEVLALFDVFLDDVAAARVDRAPVLDRRENVSGHESGSNATATTRPAASSASERRAGDHRRRRAGARVPHPVGKGGRGFPGVKRLTLDEWLFGKPGDLGALAPTMVTMPDAQIRYASSSAGKVESRRCATSRNAAGRATGGSRTSSSARRERPRRAGPRADRCSHPRRRPVRAERPGLWWQANSGLWTGRAARYEDVAQQRQMLTPPSSPASSCHGGRTPPARTGGAIDSTAFACSPTRTRRGAGRCGSGSRSPPTGRGRRSPCAWRRPGGGVHVSVGLPSARIMAADRVAEVRRRGAARSSSTPAPGRGTGSRGVAADPRGRSGARRGGAVRRGHRPHPAARRRPGTADRGVGRRGSRRGRTVGSCRRADRRIPDPRRGAGGARRVTATDPLQQVW